MDEELDKKINREAIHGMFVEHDYGRLFIRGLEESLEKVRSGDRNARLDVIANAIAYTDLLHRHIHKEDTALYMFAQKNLSSKVLEDIEALCREVEKTAEARNIQKKYTTLVDELEEKA